MQAYVISDLHIGGATDKELGDFHQDLEFVQFLEAIEGPNTTLIINGDFIDFAQIPPYEVPRYQGSQPCYLLWTEQASLQKLEAARLAHDRCFDAMARFIAKGSKLQVVIGNHDLDLVWEGVQESLRELLGSPTRDQLTFFVGHTMYEKVWIEHGHEITPENCPSDPQCLRPYLEQHAIPRARLGNRVPAGVF
jgi:UDP-2,3-diacylglucosamine pyrophosphatase LpxH